MTVKALLGLQWGDEGKGKMVDILSATNDYIVRCQGGSNAGHTVKVQGETTVLHLIPSGVLSPHTICVIGHGVVLDPAQFLAEVETLEGKGIEVAGRLFVSNRAHVVFPFHKMLDSAQEAAREGAKIGTTKRGIGPCYEEKASRQGLRVLDLLDEDRLRTRLEADKSMQIKRLESLGAETAGLDETLELYLEYGRQLAPFVADTVSMLHDALADKRKIFLEGAQGVLLDLDLGTYPYVTSSTTNIGGLIAGSGIPARAIECTFGVLKAYTTRVGAGPFPTELEDEVGQGLRDRGAEYGATTGRPRRCGWFDAVAAKFAIQVNGVDKILLTKSDVLSGCEEIAICKGYRIGGKVTTRFPADSLELEQAEPIYEIVPGWTEDISGVRSYDDLPANMKAYVDRIEKLCDAPVSMVSVGPGREAIIER
ncbi:MAG: adenylosuccinate synthase [Planctomycetota bacterium]|jgi:adenylosuccinate synthase